MVCLTSAPDRGLRENCQRKQLTDKSDTDQGSHLLRPTQRPPPCGVGNLKPAKPAPDPPRGRLQRVELRRRAPRRTALRCWWRARRPNTARIFSRRRRRRRRCRARSASLQGCRRHRCLPPRSARSRGRRGVPAGGACGPIPVVHVPRRSVFDRLPTVRQPAAGGSSSRPCAAARDCSRAHSAERGERKVTRGTADGRRRAAGARTQRATHGRGGNGVGWAGGVKWWNMDRMSASRAG